MHGLDNASEQFCAQATKGALAGCDFCSWESGTSQIFYSFVENQREQFNGIAIAASSASNFARARSQHE
jgi:hypothetical protein